MYLDQIATALAFNNICQELGIPYLNAFEKERNEGI